MGKTLKRLLSLAIVLIMVIGMIPTQVFAAEAEANNVAEVNGTEYATVAEAVAAANAGDTVTLLASIDKLPVIDKAITIDGAGQYVAGTAGENQFGSINGTVTIKNVKFTNGNEAIRTDYLSADYSNLDLVISGCEFNNLTTYAIMGGQTDPNNHLLKSLTVKGCTFNAAEAGSSNYMVYAQCVGTLNVEGCTFNGNNVTKGAIHTGDSTAYATVATISGNTISGVARGIQVGNRVEGSSVAVSDNAFTNVTTAADSKSGAVYIHGNANVETTEVTVTENTFDSASNVIYNDGKGETLSQIITTFTGNTQDETAIEMDASGNVAEGSGETETTVSGTISGCLVDLSDSAETFIASEITGLNATESVVIKLYSGETQIATTTLKKTEYFQTSPLGVKIIITGDSSSWETVWAEGMPRADMVPDKVVLYVDGQEMNSANVPMTSTNGELAVNWAEVPGVNPAPSVSTYVVYIGETGYETLDAALDAAKAANMTEVEITVKEDIAISTKIKDFTKVTFNGTDRAQTIDMNLGAAIDVNTELVFNDLTVSRLDSDWLYHYTYIRGGLTYNDCKMVGLFNVSVQDTDFIGCDFYNDDTFGNGSYSLWLYNCAEGVEVNVTDCTFDVYERAIKMYGDAYNGAMTLNISGTEFVSRTADKTVVEMAYDNSTGVGSMNLNIADSTATGFGAPEHIEGETNAWFNVEGSDTVSTVNVDGEKVWPETPGPEGDIQVAYVTANFNGSGNSGIFGEATGVVGTESFVVKLYSGETLVGTAALVDTDKVLLNGESKTITWHILTAEDDDSWWDTDWVTALNVNAIPDKVELWVDGVKVSEGEVELNDTDLSAPICAAVTDDDGDVQSFVAGTGYLNGVGTNAPVYDEALQTALNAGGKVTLLRDVALTSLLKVNGKSFTLEGNGHSITGSGALWLEYGTYDIRNVVFEDITYNANYGVLEFNHATATVTGCTFRNNNAVNCIAVDCNTNNGTSNVTVEGCTFTGNTCSSTVINIADGAATVKGSEITGNTAGIAVIYTSTDSNVTGNYFSDNTLTGTNANKAAIVAGPWVAGTYEINITGNAFVGDTFPGAYVENWAEEYNASTAYDLNSNYWNGGEPNYGKSGAPDVTIEKYYTECSYENGELILSQEVEISYAAEVNGTKYETIAEAIAAAQAGDTVTILAGEYTGNVSVNKAITLTGEEGVVINGKLSVSADGAAVKNLTVKNPSGDAATISAKNVLIEDCDISGSNAFRYCYSSGKVTFKDSKITAGTWAIHFDGSAGGDIVVDNCEVNGWIAFGGSLDKVTLQNSTFEQGDWAGGRTYNKNVVIDSCTFNEGYKFDLTSADAVVTVTNTENATALFHMEDIANGKITVDGEVLGLVISTEEDLQALAALVNGGNSLKGMTVVLANDITLTEAHTPIGTSANPFKGIFDGQNYTISDLVIEQDVETTQRSALFGQANNAVIKNVKVNNVKASGLARVAAIVGGATVTTVENCHVTGDISLCGYQYVGAIVGYGYATIKDCSVAGSADNYGDYTVPSGDSYGKMYMGGIAGWLGEGNSSISGCSAKYLNLTTDGNVGAITGLAHYGNTVADCSAAYVNITANSANQRPGSVGLIAGGCAGTEASPTIFSGNTVSNVVATDGGEAVTVLYGTDPMGNGTEAVTNYVAEVNGTYYESLADAIAQGGTVKLMKNVTVTESVVIPEGVTVTLDLNGKTLQTDASVNDQTSVHTIINNGSLTVIDSVGGGAVVANDCYTAEDGTKTKNGYAINSTGTLVIDGAKIEGTNWGYAVVVSGKTTIEEGSVIQGRGAVYAASGADVTINGGDFKISVLTTNARDHVICLDGGDAVINGGNFDGTLKTAGSNNFEGMEHKGSSAVMLMNSASSVVINGGTFAASEADIYGYASGTTATVNGGTFQTGLITRTGAEIDLYGGTYTYDPADYCAEGFVPEENDDGTYGVIDDPSTHYISNLDELKAFRDDVNAGNTYKGVTVYVTADIDLGSEEWTPIGNSTNKFQGIFDAQNHIISNLVINGGTGSNIGFFGMTTGGEVKNLTINNAKVYGRLNVGVVAGTPYTSKYTNITITGDVIVEGMSYVGGVGGKNAYADWTDITVNVNDGSYVKATSTENGTAYRTYVGGVVGFMGEGGHTFSNITSNIDVIGDVCDIGGIVGIAHYGNNFVNVTCSGDVTNTNSDAADVMETGGIAGVWHNGGSAVTFENLTYTGTVSTPNAGEVELPNGGMIGAAYSASGTGEIDGSVAIIEGKSYATLADALAAVQEGQTIYLLAATISEGTVKMPVELKNVTIQGTEGTVLKDMTLMAADGNTLVYEGITIDGIVFDNSNIVVTGWRSGTESYKNWTITNCTFKNIVRDSANQAAVHINLEAASAIENFTFTNNVIDGVSGASNSGVYAQLTGNVTISNNVINNVAFRPYVIQITTDDGIDDNFVVTGNTFSGSAVGRAQGLTNNDEGTDNVTLVVTGNIFKGITDAQQICYWNFNEETTTADLSKNYYDIDIASNPSKIYYNSAAQDVEDLIEMGIYPYYADEAMTTLVTAPAIMVTYADGTVEYFDDMREAVPHSSNVPKLEGATVTLLQDMSGLGMRLMENGMVFDLNGHTYTLTGGTGSKGTETSGFQIRPEVTEDATIKNGTIKIAEGVNIAWMFNSYAADFILEDVIVDCANMNWDYGTSCYVHVSHAADDNTQIIGNTQFVNFNSEVAGSAINVAGTMTIGENVVPGGSIELDAGATLTGPAGLDVVTVDGYEVVYANGVYSTQEIVYVAQIGETKYETIAEALTAAQAGDTVTIFAGEYDAFSVNKAITVIGETDADGNNLVTINGKLSVTGTGVTVKNLNVNNSSERAVYVSGGNILIEGCNLTGVHGLRYCYANNGDVTLKDCVITGSTYGVHFDAGSGEGNVIIEGCEITGWTSFGSAIEGVTITDTEFKDGNYNQLRFYQDVTMTGCTFNPEMTIDFGKDEVTANLNNCSVTDGSALTDVIYLGDIVDMGVKVYVDDVLLTVEATVTDAEGNTEYYQTLEEAVAAAKDGDTVTLVADVELTESLVLNTEGTITIDGNGHKITQAEGYKDTQNGLIMLGATTDGDAEAATRIYTIKNVTFEGINDWSVIRSQGVTLTMDGCTITGCTQTNGQALLRLDYTEATIKNTTISGNNALMAITHNFNGNSSNSKLTVDNCVIENNTFNKTAAIYYVTGSGCEITNSEFVNNTVNCNQNGATVYLGFQDNCTVTGNLFKDNKVTDSSTSKRVAGAIFAGYQAVITGNAFDGNSAANANGDALGQDVCISTYYEEGLIDLTGNYWGGNEPVPGADYFVQHQDGDGEVSVNSYYESCTLDAEGNVVLSGEVEMTAVAQIEGSTVKYSTLQAALDAANEGDTITLLDNITLTEPVNIENVNVDLGGKILSLKTTGSGTIGDVTISNGTIDISGGTAENGNCYLTVGGKWADDATLNLDKVTLTGTDYTSKWAVICVHNDNALNITDSTVTLTDELGAGGGFIKDTSGNNNTAAITIENTDITLTNVKRGFTGGKIALLDVDMTITGGEHGINGSELVVENSNITIKDGTGRGITVAAGPVEILNSNVTISNMGEGSIRYKSDEQITVAGTSTVNVETIVVDSGAALEDVLYASSRATVTEMVAGVIDADGAVTYYATLAAAVAAAEDGETVTLLSDATGSGIVFANGKNVVIDLNGYTYTLNESVGSSAQYGTVGFYLWAGSNVTIQNGTINMVPDEMGDDVTFFKMFHTYGDLTLTDVTLDCANGVAYNGSTDAGFIAVESDNGTVTLNGATSIINAELSPETWTVTAYKNGKITIDTTGTIEGTVVSYGSNASVELKNGNFTETNASYDLLVSISSGSIAVSGGTYSEDVTAFCIEGYVAYETSEGIWTVKELPDVAKIGDTYYKSLAAAFAAAKAGDVVELLADITVTDQIKVADNSVLSNITLNGNGHTITADLDQSNESVLYFGDTSGAWATGVKIHDLTIDGTARFGIMLVGGLSSELTNVTISGNYFYGYGINLYGTHGATMTNCDVVGMFTNGQDDNPLNLVNTKVGHLYANKSDAVDGAKVFIDENSSVEQLTFWGDATIMIDPASTERIGTINEAVAEINGVYYKTLAAAIEAAQAGDTVELLADVTEAGSYMITDGDDITVKGNGYTITCEDGFYVTGGKLTLSEDLTVEASVYNAVYIRGGEVITSANLYATGVYSAIQGNGSMTGDVTINGGNIESTNGITIYWPQEGKLTINGGSVTGGTAVYLKSGSLEITGGELIGNGTKVDYAYTVNGATATGDALVIENVAAEGYEAISSVSITGGTFKSTNASAVGSYAAEGAEAVTGFIADGKFSSDVTDLCVEGYEAVLGDDGMYSIVEAAKLPTLEGVTMTLGNSLSMNFVVDTAKLSGEGHYAVIVKSYADGTTKTVTVDREDWEVYDGEWYSFAFDGVAAKEMTDEISVIIYDNQGVQATQEWIDSVEKYSLRMLSNVTSDEEATMFVDMLNYGAAAQDYFGYKTDDLANAELSAEQQAMATQAVSMENGRVEGTGYAGSALTLVSRIQLDVVFNDAEIAGAAYAVATYNDHYGTPVSKTCTFEVFDEGRSMISITSLNVADCSQTVTLTVYDADGNVLSTVVESVESYIARMADDHELYTNIMKFATSAYNYFHREEN